MVAEWRKARKGGEEVRGRKCVPQNEFLATPMPTSLQCRCKPRYLTLLTQGIGLIFCMILVLTSKCDYTVLDFSVDRAQYLISHHVL